MRIDAFAPAAAVLCLMCGSADAEDAAARPSSAAGFADAPVPYYVGASEAVTHDSNVYRIHSGPGDTYSSTSLLGGFDQSIDRQHLFGSATVSANRYRDQSLLDNTSYHARAGLDWSTIARLSGNLTADLGRSLSAPAIGAGSPGAERNLAKTENVLGTARWGGDALVTLEATAGYSKIDYSLPGSASSNASETREGLSAFFRPGGSLKLGLGARTSQRRTPQALGTVPVGESASNDVRANTLELLFEYDRGGWLQASGHAGYTRQTNSNPVAHDQNFSGGTGRLDLGYRLSGKLSANAFASRDASLGASLQAFRTAPATTGDAGAAVGAPAAPYQNSQITNAAGIGLIYAATAKISAGIGGRYARATLLTTAANAGNSDKDTLKTAYLNLDYAITQRWSAACSIAHESRSFSGSGDFSYASNAVGCSAQFTLR